MQIMLSHVIAAVATAVLLLQCEQTYSHRALPNEFLMQRAPFSQGLGEQDTNPENRLFHFI